MIAFIRTATIRADLILSLALARIRTELRVRSLEQQRQNEIASVERILARFGRDDDERRELLRAFNACRPALWFDARFPEAELRRLAREGR